MITLFSKTCACGAMILGPRVGNKARGQWLGFDQCQDCRVHSIQEDAGTAQEAPATNNGNR